MSALAHLLEDRGLPTTVIALVLPQVEKTRPPRALMVPFMLGRPLGEPNDRHFQRKVLLQALGLLTRTDGPVLLEHFPEDNPGCFDRPGWRPSFNASTSQVTPDTALLMQAFKEELTAARPAWERFQKRFGRTTVGLSTLDIQAWPDFVGAYLKGDLPTVLLHETPALSIRFLVDDIKALYGEAAQAEGEAPSARQIDLWFWRETVAGKVLLALRTVAMQSSNNGLKTVGGRFFVPAPYLPA